MPLPDDDLRKKTEALLFSVGKKIDISELAKHLRCKDMEQLQQVLKEIQQAYDERQSPMMVVNDGTFWKIVVKEKYHPVVKKVVAEIELSKTLMETLALVAWKNPCKQSEIIETRSNKGYGHLDELERMGFITRKKYGRTKLISLTEKFFNYFELSGHEDIKEAFKKIKEIEEKKMLEYAEKKAQQDLRRQKAQEIHIVNQKAFLEKIDRQLEKEVTKETDVVEKSKPDLEDEIKNEEEKQESDFEKKIEESSEEEKKGTDEEDKAEDYDEKLDEEGMPNLDEDKEDEEEELLDEEREEKKVNKP